MLNQNDVLLLKEIATFTVKEMPECIYSEEILARGLSIDDLYDRILTEDNFKNLIGEIKNSYEGDVGGFPFCSCGHPNIALELIYRILSAHKDLEETEDFRRRDSLLNEIFPGYSNADNELQCGLYQIVIHMLCESDFLDHGSSCFGCWLTDKGEMYLKVCDLYYKFDEGNPSNGNSKGFIYYLNQN